ncbi:diguanylate cyclase [Orenia marismortui]|uniref:PAS domain S-box-containing protein/diguanylate cyclase (GGDEF)-like protein n=1 Tax=Orenia marismortui TaxID=46469 RepID=A0A4R8H3A2_9FIRM|nr:diguanylate cyclase [Orenia marismortui]TDX53220.1 PAS domain S-box-containing protein/diguanylate cyclase (GGDEF)-like protein [Orenia marismortui]
MKNRFKYIVVSSILLILLLIISSHNSKAQGYERKNILLIHSYNRGFTWTDDIDKGIRETFDKSNLTIDIETEYLSTKRILKPSYFKKIYDFFKYKYEDTNFDMIIVSDNDALEFLFRYGKELFPNTPVVFTGVSNIDKYNWANKESYTGIIEDIDIQATINLILKLHPQTTNIAAILDRTTTGKDLKLLIKNAISNIPAPISLTIYQPNSINQIDDILENISDNSVIILSSSLKDNSGDNIVVERVSSKIVEHSDLPIYSFWDFYIGHGIVGGKLSSGYTQGKMAAEISIDLFKGKEAEIKVAPNHFIFDYQQLQRMGINRTGLPANSKVVNQPYSFYRTHKKKIWVVSMVIIALCFVIFILVMNILKRKIAEDRLKASEEKYRVLFENTGTAKCIIEEDTTISLVNQEFVDLLGYEKEEIEGKMSSTELVINEGDLYKILSYHQQRRDHYIGAPKKYELQLKDKSSNIKTVILQVKLIPRTNRSIVSVIDISDRKELEEQMRFLSYHDSLTGLYNRKFFEEELHRLDTRRQLPLSIIIGDANGLKLTNDVFGHEAGDNLLKEIANILEDATRKEDIIARWGGDEFGIILPRTANKEAKKVIKRIEDKFKNSNFEPLPPQIALGVASKTDERQKIEDTFNKAEKMMYEDKKDKKDSQENPLLKSLTDKLQSSNYEGIGHTSRLIELSEKIGQKLELSDREIERLILLAKYHDIGKLALSKDVFKKEGLFDKDEFENLKKHSEVGYNIAKSFPELRVIANEILYHHEDWNGEGYPEGLKEEDIPLLARIMHLIDIYDAITHRSYHTINSKYYYEGPLSKEEAIEEIKDLSGVLFDPTIVNIFLDLMNESGGEDNE